ncbi:uncharacterized protein LOC129780221 [Toxorhynchites rutilus septentrionalis]|uniref:uncharacterized protein LOC129780221 n=1 Tax=Toxorhynchites rutilus septentrionalis TaxID=329112 RepID=UPI0024787C87|nr:uncharacterized protein LOC129780221 [Toxorhynchites rutilus septentrionalis]
MIFGHENIEVLEEIVLVDDVEGSAEKSISSDSGRKRKNQSNQEQMYAVFVDVLEEVGKILLSKSQTPVREKKKIALAAMRQQLFIRCGLEFSGDQILKKINNMKTTVKEKTDTKKTGNVKIVLNQPQEKFYGLRGVLTIPASSAFRMVWQYEAKILQWGRIHRRRSMILLMIMIIRACRTSFWRPVKRVKH